MSADNWILTYYQQIQDGSVTVGSWIRKWYEIIVHGLEEKRWTFDQKKANAAINFIERYCHHHEGPLAPGLMKLEIWQKAFLSIVFGIMDLEGRRQFREIILIIGRKQGKTAIMSGIGCYHLFVDGGYGSRVYVCAPKLEQARLCYEGIYQTIRKEPMMERLTKRRRTDLYIESNNSSAQPLAFSAKKSDGLNISLGILDEAAAFAGEPGLRQAEVVKSSQGARPEPQLFYPTTANFIDGGLYDELMKRATAVINGTSKEVRLAPFLYMIDDVEKWNDINELRKSLPNLGVSVSVDYILEEIAVAEGSISKKSEFLTKYCNIKQNSSQAWLTAQDVKKCFSGGWMPGWKRMFRDNGNGTFSAEDDRPNALTLEDFRHTYALAGIDLSLAVDLTAAVICIEKDGVTWFDTQFFMPENKVAEATARDGLPYDIYRQRGLLTVCGENTVDYHAVHEWFNMLEREYEILPLKVGYDRYSAAYLVQDMQADGFDMESVSQGSNLTGVLIDMEGMIKDGRLRCMRDNDLMKIHMLDAALKFEDGTNRRRLIKITPKAHIDGMAALSDAICMRHNYYEELAGQLSNKR